jgi:chaperonin cofactor prefoldin
MSQPIAPPELNTDQVWVMLIAGAGTNAAQALGASLSALQQRIDTLEQRQAELTQRLVALEAIAAAPPILQSASAS